MISTIIGRGNRRTIIQYNGKHNSIEVMRLILQAYVRGEF